MRFVRVQAPSQSILRTLVRQRDWSLEMGFPDEVSFTEHQGEYLVKTETSTVKGNRV